MVLSNDWPESQKVVKIERRILYIACFVSG